MRLLLDTQCWLWMRMAPARLSPEVTRVVTGSDNELFLSAASSWEIAIKYALGKLRLPMDPADYVLSRLAETRTLPLDIRHAHALQVARLPLHHRDPFDRMLIAQAQVERLSILTADRRFSAYDVQVFWA